jgi:hypothetical protein
MGMRLCTKCKVEQPKTNFNKHTDTKDKLAAWCKSCIKKSSKEWQKNNPNKDYTSQRKWNKRKRADGYFKQYAEGGYWNEYQKRRRVDDPFYSLYINLRSRISNLLTGKTRSQRTQQIIGIPVDEFKAYLESLWSEGMSWSNYGYGDGKWVLDHKQPIASATSEDEILTLNHYTNLQPMWFMDNLIKRDKAGL